MEFNSGITYYCKLCGAFTSTLHEIIFGHGNRNIAIKHNVQVPLCVVCHAIAHKEKEKYQREFLEWLGLDFYTTLRAFNDVALRKYLEINAEHCLQKIMSREV